MAIGRSIANIALRDEGLAIADRLLAVEAGSEEARLAGPELTELVLPQRTHGRRIAALRFGDPRVMALHAALVAIAHQAAGFTNAQLRRIVAALLDPRLGEYSRARMTYDLERLVGHGLVARRPGTHRYRLTDLGLRIAAACTTIADRVLDPAIARCRDAPPSPAASPWRRFESALDAIVREAHMAA